MLAKCLKKIIRRIDFRYLVTFKGLAVLFLIGSSLVACAEGSKELNPDGGDRAYLYSSTNVGYQGSNPYPTQGLVRVYVKSGEVIYVGSSAQGVGTGAAKGTIHLRAPNGAYYTTGTSNTVGRINNRAQEMAGPKHGIAPEANPAGYNAATFSVAPAEEGIWEIYFIAPTNNALTFNTSKSENFGTAGNTQSTTSAYVAAFDVTVRSNEFPSGKFISGRAYINVFGATLGAYNRIFTGAFKVLTKDGYQYDVKSNGLAGHIFVFFANNKGYRNAAGAPTYKSENSLSVSNLQNPLSEDTDTDISHKLFFNTPATDLPQKSPIRSSDGIFRATAGTLTETWLLNIPEVISATSFSIKGAEGTPGLIGTNPLGGYICFNSNQKGSYSLTIDINNNGPDASDVIITGLAAEGYNEIYWNGLDGTGNKVANSVTLQPEQIKIILKNGEVHFPFIDVENNTGGITITRINGSTGVGDNKVYWDDSNLTSGSGSIKPVPISTTSAGVNSAVNGHKWGNDFGDNKGIDTWTYVESTPLAASATLQLQEADLQVLNDTPMRTVFCMGAEEDFAIVVKNNGPSPVKDAKFNVKFPAEFGSLRVVNSIIGAVSISSHDITDNQYNAILDMENGASITFTFTGTPIPKASTYNLNVVASIMRPADVTDPDATNPDSDPPGSAQEECDAAPSGSGCNNIINKITTVQKVAVPFIMLDN